MFHAGRLLRRQAARCAVRRPRAGLEFGQGPGLALTGEGADPPGHWGGKVMPHSARMSSMTRSVVIESVNVRRGDWSWPVVMQRAVSAASKCRASWAVRGSV